MTFVSGVIGAWMAATVTLLGYIAYGTSYEAQLTGGGVRYYGETMAQVTGVSAVVGFILGFVVGALIVQSRRRKSP